MWSGPRNLSTTLMRSFGARADTACTDEPFYAAYLAATGIEHPMRDEVLAAHETDWAKVARALVPSRDPDAAPVHYQKHMTHHMVPAMPRDWMAEVRHVFLVRHPARVIVSFLKKTGFVSLDAIGLPQQTELFETARRLTGATPVVVDGDAILRAPAAALARVCAAVGIPEDPAMLRWDPGPRPEDGVWGRHWYDVVWRSSGFGPPPGPLPEVPPEAQPVLAEALEPYRALCSHALG